jgi:ABC-2 type transport system ATP-binding protein
MKARAAAAALPDAGAGVAISARGLSRHFGPVVAVAGIDLDIPRGRIYGFLGPNGSGKSTTLRMLCGLLGPSAGLLRVLGHEMPREAHAVRRKLGYMTQKFSLWEDLTVRENLDFMSRIHGVAAARRRARIDERMARYRLVDLAGRRAGTLSGGQRQRLGLAAATLHEPELLLLDEPTSAVDPQSRRDFWEGLFELAALGTTILVSTHYMDEAERCHRLAILDLGRIVAEGEPRSLMAGIDATVVEVEAAEMPAVRATLQALDGIRSMAQLGARLHVLMRRELQRPEESVTQALHAAGVAARVERVSASLEDVFVAATGFREREGRLAGDGR